MVAYGSKTADQANVQPATWATIAASCNATAMPDIASSPAAIMACGSRDAGLICGVSSLTSRQWRVCRGDRDSRAVEAVVGRRGRRAQVVCLRRGWRRGERASITVAQSLFVGARTPRISGKSKLAEAIRYARSRRAALLLFLDDGRVEIDSNIVERAIRPQAITGKNSLFAGSVCGGRWASIATLMQTCKMNDVDPQAWLADVLDKIANRHPMSKIDELLPWAYINNGAKRQAA